jgi:hypothetical protein
MRTPLNRAWSLWPAFVSVAVAAAALPPSSVLAATTGTARNVCHPTRANSGAPPVDFVRGSFFVSNGTDLWVAIPHPSGKVSIWDGEAKRLRDGSVSMILPWWNTGSGTLELRGRRLDRRAPAPTFHGQGVTLPSTGCWRIVGSNGTSQLSVTLFVVNRAG